MEQREELGLFERLKRNGRTADGSVSFLSEWDAVRYIDSGAYGVVFEIVKTNRALGEQHSALKIIEIKPGSRRDEENLKRYKDEIAALSVIRNLPNAVRIEDFSELLERENGFVRRYLVIRMELLNSMPADGMSEDEVIRMGIEVSNVLANCHSRKPKILHCDIKPPNILLTDDGIYKLSDFGEAKFLDKSRGSSGMRGTPFYMAPEMFRMEGYDERCDLYSLGITMYAMLGGGKVPFYSEELSDNEIVRKRLTGAAFPRISGVHPKLMRIIRKLCAIVPEKRYQRADQLGRDLERLVKHKKEQEIRRKNAEAARILRDQKRRARADAKAAAADALIEQKNNALMLGETVTDSQRERLAEVSGIKETSTAKKFAGSKPGKIALAAACAVVVITGAVFGIGAIAEQQREAQRIAEEQRLSAEQQIDNEPQAAEPQKTEEQQATLEPKTEADRALAEEFNFVSGDNGVVLAKYIGTDTKVEIPARYNDMPVVVIGDYAFNACSDLISVTIPDSVTSIEKCAFLGCPTLTSITIPKSVNSIGESAFKSCAALTSITIPGSVRIISNDTFYGCRALTSVIIGAGVYEIRSHAFRNCDALRSITIPNGVTSIGTGAFSFCNSLTSITIPYSVTYIANSAFSYCENLTSITIPDSVDTIGSSTFSQCKKLTSVTIPNSVVRIGEEAFGDCANLTSIIIPDSVTSIGNDAFGGCTIKVKAPYTPAYYRYNINDASNENVTWVVTD